MPFSSIRARDIMNSEVPYCQFDTPLLEVSKRFAEESIHGVFVVDDEMRLLGVITESDLIDQQANIHVPTAIAIFDMVIPLGEQKFQQEMDRLQAMVASDIMVEDIKSVSPDTSLLDIASMMSDEHVHHLPVIEDNAVIGMVTKSDIIKQLTSQIHSS